MNEPQRNDPGLIQADLTEQDKTYGMICHLSILSGYITGFGFIVGPLVAWLLLKDKSEFADYNGKEALNFQLSMLIYSLISILLVLVVIGILFLIVLGILNIVFPIIAAVEANQGKTYRYPLTIRFVR